MAPPYLFLAEAAGGSPSHTSPLPLLGSTAGADEEVVASEVKRDIRPDQW